MTTIQPENASKSYKCERCGTMFEISNSTTVKCPICGNICSQENCSIIESSDEGF